MDLRNTQLKDTYGNLVTTGTTAGSPTTGGLQNGQGTLLTSVGIGTDSPNALLELSGRSDTGDITMRFADKDGGVLTGQDHSNIEYFATDGSAVSAEVKTIYADVVGGLDYTISTRAGGGSLAERLRIRSTGDISFRDGSASEAFYWDASAGSLGIGTTSPNSPLTATKLLSGNSYLSPQSIRSSIENASVYGYFSSDSDDLTANKEQAGVLGIARVDSGTAPGSGNAVYGVLGVSSNAYGGGVNDFALGAIGDAYISGNVGIGTTSPSEKLQINSGYIKVVDNAYDEYFFSKERTDGSQLVGFQSHSAGALSIHSAGSEAMRINSSGNVGIGTDAPLAPLNIGVDSATASPIRAIKLGAGTTVVGNGQYIQFSTSTVDSLGSQIQGVRAGAGASSDLRFLTTNTSSVVSEKMRINSSGNVGIGTSSPNIGGWSKALTVQGASNAAIEVTEGTVRTSLISAAGTAGYVGTDTNHPLLFRTNSTERMRIDSSGNVGIGTNDPSTKLEVLGSSNSNYLRLSGDDAAGARGLDFTSFTVNANAGAGHQINAKSIYGTLTFATNATERMRIDSSGKVGIGTDTVLGSATRLHVKVDDSNTDFSLGTPYHLLIENDNTTTNTGAMLGLRADTADGGIALHYGGSANVGYMTFHVDAGGGANSERMRIDSSGDVLVGKTTVSLGEVGVEVKPNGEVRCTTNGAQTLQLNRLTSDGTIVDFRKDSTVSRKYWY
jgi:hypothetical protein